MSSAVADAGAVAAGVEPTELELLVRGLRLGDGFQLYLIAFESAAGRAFVTETLAAIDGFQVVPVEVDARRERRLEDVVAAAFATCRTRARPIVVVHDADDWSTGATDLLRSLNEQRSRLIASAPGAVVFLGGRHFLETFRRVAPDVWSVRNADAIVDEPGLRGAGSCARRGEYDTEPRRSAWAYEAANLLAELPSDQAGTVACWLAERLIATGAELPLAGRLLSSAAAAASDRPRFATLCRINRARALSLAGDVAAARQELQTLIAQQPIEGTVRVYAHQSMAVVLACAGENGAAIAETDAAITESIAQGDHGLHADCRLQRGRLLAHSGNRRGALDDALAADRSAARIGDHAARDRARLLAGTCAAIIGRRGLAMRSWRRYLGGGEVDDGRWQQLLATLTELDDAREAAAARLAWNVIAALALRLGESLTEQAIRYLHARVVLVKADFDLAAWHTRVGADVAERIERPVSRDIVHSSGCGLGSKFAGVSSTSWWWNLDHSSVGQLYTYVEEVYPWLIDDRGGRDGHRVGLARQLFETLVAAGDARVLAERLVWPELKRVAEMPEDRGAQRTAATVQRTLELILTVEVFAAELERRLAEAEQQRSDCVDDTDIAALNAAYVYARSLLPLHALPPHDHFAQAVRVLHRDLRPYVEDTRVVASSGPTLVHAAEPNPIRGLASKLLRTQPVWPISATVQCLSGEHLPDYAGNSAIIQYRLLEELLQVTTCLVLLERFWSDRDGARLQDRTVESQLARPFLGAIDWLELLCATAKVDDDTRHWSRFPELLDFGRDRSACDRVRTLVAELDAERSRVGVEDGRMTSSLWIDRSDHLVALFERLRPIAVQGVFRFERALPTDDSRCCFQGLTPLQQGLPKFTSWATTLPLIPPEPGFALFVDGARRRSMLPLAPLLVLETKVEHAAFGYVGRSGRSPLYRRFHSFGDEAGYRGYVTIRRGRDGEILSGCLRATRDAGDDRGSARRDETPPRG